jgi:hypothetical protein
MTAEEELPAGPLAIGSVVGGGFADKEWRRAITVLAKRVIEIRDDYESPLSVNVIYHVPGEVVPKEFLGVRTGHYSSAKGWLIVQAAVPEHPAGDADAEVRQLLWQAVDAAERFAERRKIADALPNLRRLLADL